MLKHDLKPELTHNKDGSVEIGVITSSEKAVKNMLATVPLTFARIDAMTVAWWLAECGLPEVTKRILFLYPEPSVYPYSHYLLSD